MSDLSIAELEDSANTVYAIGVAASVSEAVTEYLYGPDFEDLWTQKFDHADYIIVPGEFDGIVELEAQSVEQVREVLEEDNDD